GKKNLHLDPPKREELNVDKNGTVNITDAKGATLTLDAQANRVTLEDANGNSMVMDSSGTVVKDGNGNQITMAAGQLTVKGTMITIEGSQVALGGAGGEPLIKGTSFLTLFATHTHTCAVGPTSPPVPQGDVSD